MTERKTIGVLVPWMSGRFLGAILAGAHATARRHDMDVVMICTGLQTPESRDGGPTETISSPPGADLIAGWITIGDALSPEGYARLAERGAPIVTIARNVKDRSFPQIVGDNSAGTAESVRHLIEHGHTRIAFVGSQNISDLRERHEGYEQALRAHGIEPDAALLLDVDRPGRNMDGWPPSGYLRPACPARPSSVATTTWRLA
jgi:DNA-binding LacI/PurR family transcriptional regulator